MRRWAPVLLAALAAGCGGESGDLLAIEVSGGPQGTDRTIVVTGDGRGRCDGGELQPISNQQLIDARELERELTELDEEERRFGGGEGRSYVARARDGALRWSEGTEPKPELLPRLELLALQLGRELC
ncbi:MAG: hypothetical protein WD844_12865 [Thermoleophilaceae bacterium]